MIVTDPVSLARGKQYGGLDMDDGESRLREALRAGERLTPFVGAGLSSAMTDEAPCATWRGLLSEGIDTCKRWVREEPEEWAEDLKKQLKRRDKHSLLSVGDEVSRRLREPHEGREFKSWIDRTVGRLTPKDDAAAQTLKAVRSLDTVVVTTNYDTIIEHPKPPEWTSYTWNDGDFASAFIKPRVVLHLHGVATKPESIILGSADYQKLSDNERNNILGQSLFLIHRFIFIGCGDGLNDPHLAPLLEQMIELAPVDGQDHFILVTEEERDKLPPDKPSPRITPVAYGAGYEELPGFLQGLAAETVPDMKATPGRTQVSPVAGAQAKLRSSLDSQNRLKEALRKVESCRAVTDMRGLWDDLAEEDAEHVRLAERLKNPATNLDVSSRQALSELRKTITDVWGPIASASSAQRGRLVPISDVVSELARVSQQLLVTVANARDDLNRRADTWPCYEAPADSLTRAHTSFEKMREIIRGLQGELGRQQVSQETETQSTQPPQARMPSPDSTPADPLSAAGESAHRSVSRGLAAVRGQAAAGPAMSTGDSDERQVTVPPQYAHRDDLSAIQVKGDSLEKDGILHDDFVTVLPKEEECNDGDMVVATFGGESDAEAQVKWLKLREGSRWYLQGSDPDDITELKESDVRALQKVVGVVRWNIRKLS